MLASLFLYSAIFTLFFMRRCKHYEKFTGYFDEGKRTG